MLALTCLLSLGPLVMARPPAARQDGPDSTAVPIELLDGDRAVVLATLDGRGPYRLAVETGHHIAHFQSRSIRGGTGFNVGDHGAGDDTVKPHRRRKSRRQILQYHPKFST